MLQMRRCGALVLVVAASYCWRGACQAGDPATMIQEKLVSQIKLTKSTADHTDVVTAGDIVMLHKDGLMMCSSASPYAFSNTYANGALTANQNNRAKDAAKSFLKGRLPFGGGGSVTDAANNGCQSRKFVAGEKFWVTGIVLQKDGILVSTFSDPYNDTRYYGEIKFPFAKGAPIPPADAFAKTVSEVIAVEPGDDNDKASDSRPGGQTQAAGPGAAPAKPPAVMPDIAPPPPPADAPPPTISIGQTKDQVTTAFGAPLRMAKVGAKEIYYYKDMKVTFKDGKVSNVE